MKTNFCLFESGRFTQVLVYMKTSSIIRVDMLESPFLKLGVGYGSSLLFKIVDWVVKNKKIKNKKKHA